MEKNLLEFFMKTLVTFRLRFREGCELQWDLYQKFCGLPSVSFMGVELHYKIVTKPFLIIILIKSIDFFVEI